MNNTIWGKTILALSSKLPLAIKNLDNCIDAYITATFKRRCDAYKDIDELRKTILKKKNLQLVYMIYNEVIAKMNSRKTDILRYRYYFNFGFKNIAEKLDLSIRTIFRQYNTAIDDFCKVMLQIGYDNNCLFDYFGNDKFIIQEYRHQENLEARQSSGVETKVVYSLPNANKQEKLENINIGQCNKHNLFYN